MSTPDAALPGNVIDAVRRIADSDAMRALVREALAELVAVNTIPTADVAETTGREAVALRLIEDRFATMPGIEAAAEYVDVDPTIESLDEYTLPFYAANADGEIPSAAETYAGRRNLLMHVAGEPGAPALAFNAHVDTVAPDFPFREESGRLWGRGASDDKGQCVAMIGAASVVGQVAEELGVRPRTDLTFQFVIDEEMGGNGSLSLAADKARHWDCFVVCESTDLVVHPGNRGALWYRIRLEVAHDSGLNATLLAGHVLLALRAEGDRVKRESEHALFPTRPVQTCNGMFGPWGGHPSRVSPIVGLCAAPRGRVERDEFMPRFQRACDRGVASYCALRGDATQQPDPDEPGRMKVLRHYDIVPAGRGVEVTVYGKAGHMGKIDELDCAASKAAHIMREVESEFGASAQVCFTSPPPPEEQTTLDDPARTILVLGPEESTATRVGMQGGQGFVPTHSIDEIRGRIRSAAEQAVAGYAVAHGAAAEGVTMEITFERLHNNAFERPVDSVGMKAMLAAAGAAGVYDGEDVVGFEVSCDARLLADLRPDADVITFGPGQIRYAHSDIESITVDEIVKGIEVMALMALGYGVA